MDAPRREHVKMTKHKKETINLKRKIERAENNKEKTTETELKKKHEEKNPAIHTSKITRNAVGGGGGRYKNKRQKQRKK